MDSQHSTMWDEVNPSWMFQVHPREYTGYQHTWICPGVFYLAGWQGLFLFHYACFLPFLNALFRNGYQSSLLLYLLPIVVLWLILVPADVKFRLQRPTRAERNGFDNAVINWFGLLSALAIFYILPVGLVIGVIAWVWHLFI